MRFHKKIGTLKDITFGEIIEFEVEETFDNIFSGMLGGNWPMFRCPDMTGNEEGITKGPLLNTAQE